MDGPPVESSSEKRDEEPRIIAGITIEAELTAPLPILQACGDMEIQGAFIGYDIAIAPSDRVHGETEECSPE